MILNGGFLDVLAGLRKALDRSNHVVHEVVELVVVCDHLFVDNLAGQLEHEFGMLAVDLQDHLCQLRD